MDKAPDAFRTISEVADDLDVPQHVLHFWETRFAHIRPLKRGGGRRYYRPDDVDLLRGIRHLLYGEGYTIRGVQRILKDNGPKFVQAVWRSGAPQPPPNGPDREPGEPMNALAGLADGAAENGDNRPVQTYDLDERSGAEALAPEPEEPSFRDPGLSDRTDEPDDEPGAPAGSVPFEARAPQAPELLTRRPAPLPPPPALPVVPLPQSGPPAAFTRSAPSATAAAGRPQSSAPQGGRAGAESPAAAVLDHQRLAEAEAAERQLIERLAAERQAAERQRVGQKETAERQAAAGQHAERQAGARARLERLRTALLELQECRRLLDAASKDEGA